MFYIFSTTVIFVRVEAYVFANIELGNIAQNSCTAFTVLAIGVLYSMKQRSSPIA